MIRNALLLIVFVASMSFPAIAQYNNNIWAQANMNLMNNVTSAQLIARNCSDIKATGRPMPDSNCCQFKRHGNKVGSWTRLDGSCDDSVSKTTTVAKPGVKAGSSKFTPVASDNSLELFAESVGTTPDEKKLMLQIAANTKSAFEQEYGPRGWKNNLAGAYTFFVLTASMVYNDKEPSQASIDAFYNNVEQSISSDPQIAASSNKEKTALYNSLIAYGGLPLTFYLHGKQNGNVADVKKAKELAAGLVKLILKTEAQDLNKLVP